MSQENMEVVRRICALITQGDQEAAWELVSQDFVWDFSRRLIEPVVMYGRDEVRAWVEREREMWEGGQQAWQPEELIDVGDKVLAFVRVSGRGKASGAPVESRTWSLWTLRDGMAVKLEYFGDDRASALEAVGLSDQDAHADS
jgi:ketosteroid isomerase-like protein